MKAELQHKEPQQAKPIQSKRERSKLSFVDNRSQTVKQTNLIKANQKKEIGCLQRMVIQLKRTYVYGSADTIPHVECYDGSSHLKIMHRGSIKRYNIVQNGSVHVQAEIALEAARESRNDDLVQIIQGLINDVTGGGGVKSNDPDDEDSRPDDFPSMDAMWKAVGWDFKKGSKK